jgi:hypothetical protein
MNLNPMNLNSGVWPGNYQQPATSAPAANPAVASTSVGTDILHVNAPVAAYVQPGTSAPSLLPGQLSGGPMGTSGNSVGGSKP